MQKVVIIAEAGVNHNGDINTAKSLIDAAANAGADFVKFQTFIPELLVEEKAPLADYQKDNTEGKYGDDQLSMLKKLSFPLEEFRSLKAYCSKKGIGFLSTAFELKSLVFLNDLGLAVHKVPSGELTNYSYLQLMGSFEKEVYLSTGMAFMEEIEQAIEVLVNFGTVKERITVLHCHTDYPTAFSDVNLNAMKMIGDKFGVAFGYSDHTLGVEVPIAAVALGARVIEKHFTLSREMEGPDHKASLTPEELRQMVDSIRNIELAMGKAEKRPSQIELQNRRIVRKSIHLGIDIKSGEEISRESILMKRPGDGISPMEMNSLIGKKASKDLKKGHKLSWEDIL